MKLNNEICISFLLGSCWLYNHDKEITISERNKAIDDFVSACNKQFDTMYGQRYIDMRNIKEIAEQLKEGVRNEC